MFILEPSGFLQIAGRDWNSGNTGIQVVISLKSAVNDKV